MIFRSSGVEMLGRTSFMNIEYTRVALFPQSLHLHLNILNIVVWKESAYGSEISILESSDLVAQWLER